MKALKTIVATAVIVFALTTVAMAGVQHFTKQSGQAAGTQAQKAQPTYTVTLTAKQLGRLLRGQGKATTARGTRHARRVHHQRRATRHQNGIQNSYRGASRSSRSGYSSGSANSGNGSNRCYDQGSHSGNWGGGNGYHSGGGGDGGGCW